MTVQEAIQEGYTEATHLVFVWDLARELDTDVPGKIAWLKRWGSLTGTTIPERLLSEKALGQPRRLL